MDLVRWRTYTYSPQDTEAFGRRLGERLQPGDVIAIIGPLGCGKTVLARGLARGTGATGYIASPSFVVIREYTGPLRVYHADLYRLDRPEEILDLGLDELSEAGGVLIVEWADRAGDLLPAPHIRVEMAFGEAETDRCLVITAPAVLAGRLEGAVEAP
jgi:tRNA threonylcarbamoyladenosine biosynthesis protein TsaE